MLLLSCAGFEMFGFLPHRVTFQDKADIKWTGDVLCTLIMKQ